jgi:hypothetical protein
MAVFSLGCCNGLAIAARQAANGPNAFGGDRKRENNGTKS